MSVVDGKKGSGSNQYVVNLDNHEPISENIRHLYYVPLGRQESNVQTTVT